MAKSRNKSLVERQPRRVWVQFTLQVSLVVAIFVIGLYAGVFLRDRNLIQEQILTEARSHFQGIIITRLWNAMHGGVYVEKKPGEKTNPNLRDDDFSATDGRQFTLRNPALMTREISELAQERGLFSFRITSLKPINPKNAPDPFERLALESFKHGVTESTAEETNNGVTLFRYMAPLVVEKSCLSCHDSQGYKVGDALGGISVTLDISTVKAALGTSRTILVILATTTAIIVIGVFLLFAMRLMRRLQKAQDTLAKQAVTDELTGLSNRRAFFRRLAEEADRARRYGTHLSLVMFDIDHFRHVNDTYGHSVGELVLTEVARLLAANARTSDILARYGGEEFAMLIPAMGLEEAKRAAEKLRIVVEVNDLTLEGPRINVTISAGVADAASVLEKEGQLKDNLVKAADNALYQAKAKGRNRVETYREDKNRQLNLL